jgi:predicted DNA-binding protein YlxM (UPF0122 family)
MAEIMYKILQQKKEISLEDILAQFEISASTAYNVQRTLRMICEKHPDECEVQTKNRRTIFKWIKKTTEESQERQEIEKVLNAQPAPNQ